ncbi:MAG TPA: polysaccharide biosynthesis tyrosine autokinase [Nitrospirota bacterium]|nr:polysaccharide biosynthesis tyrosine autokinase [Nitrospirota bacterium]
MSENEITIGKAERGKVPAFRIKWLRRLYQGDVGPVAAQPSAQATPAVEQKRKKTATPIKITSPYIIKFTEEDAPLTEEYRKLKSVVLMMMKQNAKQNTLVVTSSESGEGKSLTAVNLALVLAQESNRTVLLVDGDLRRPALHTYLGVKPDFGLADCILDRVDLHDALIKTTVPRLNFLAAGKRTDAPAELLSSDRMKEFMQEIKNRYHDRIIIFDTPPTLIFTDIRVLSPFADGILFVVKEGVAANSVRDALAVLKGSPVLGIVYNGASPEQLNGRYHRYYRYYNRKQQDNNT